MTSRSQLQPIYGDRLPEGATSFVACAGVTTFCIGRTGQLVAVPWEGDDEDRLRLLGVIGSWGIEIENETAVQSYYIPRTGDRTAVIEGERVASASTQRHSGGPCESRWWDMVLYALQDGRYAVHVAYHTRWAGELEHDALVLSPDVERLVERLDEYTWTDRVHGFPRGHEDRQAALLRALGDCWDHAVGELLADVAPERI
jgi:hypothetical protein